MRVVISSRRRWALVAIISALLVTACGESPQRSGSGSPGREGFITERDSGKKLTIEETTRFGFWLREADHPFEDLDISTCKFLGQVTNWSLEGPDRYPIGFQVTRAGSCTVRNGDFHVRIVGVALG